MVPAYWEMLHKMFAEDPEIVIEIVGDKLVVSGSTANTETLKRVEQIKALDAQRLVTQVSYSTAQIAVLVTDFLKRAEIANVSVKVVGHEVCLSGGMYDQQSIEQVKARVTNFLKDFPGLIVNTDQLRVLKQKIAISVEFLRYDTTLARNLGVKWPDAISATASFDYGYDTDRAHVRSNGTTRDNSSEDSLSSEGGTATRTLNNVLNRAINGENTTMAPITTKAHVSVGSFAFDVACEVSAQRKTARETASDILYAHALSRLSRNPGDSTSADERELERRIDESLDEMLGRGLADFEGLSAETLQELRSETIEDMLRLGPLEPLIADDSITEIMVIDYRHIYVERKGRVVPSDRHFRDAQHLIRVIERIVSRVGRRIDESSPLVDARLEDGSRVNAVIPPITPDGACLTIRKFGKSLFTLEKLVSFGSMSPAMMKFIDACVQLRKNIVVSGGTGSGKTSLLNAISLCIGSTERIITVEDSLELKLQQSHVVRMEARPANAEGKGEVPIRTLVKNCLRMRPDRIVVGECRGGEALDMLQAMNTGHDGSLTTVHANTPTDTVARLETLCLMAGMDIPLSAIRAQIASAVSIIVQTARLSDGSRKTIEIAEVCGLDAHGNAKLRTLFEFQRSGVDPHTRKVLGSHRVVHRPTFFEDFRLRGVELDASIFEGVE